MYNQNIERSKFLVRAFVGFLAINLSLVSCQKDEEPMVESSTTNTEAYTLLDVMIVNTGNGNPRKPENLNLLGEDLNLTEDGTFSFSTGNGDLKSGSWFSEGKGLVFSASGINEIQARIESKNEDGLEFSQEYESLDGFSKGTVYYTFEKLEQ